METNKEFKFTLNVSNEGYEKKTDANACLSSKGAEAIGRKKMCFFEQTLSIDEFLDKAESGHSFCALYRFDQNKKYWYTNKQGQKFLGYPFYQKDSKTATKGGLKIDFKRDEYFSGSQVIFIDIDYTDYTDINEYINKLTFKPTCIYMSYSDNKDKNGIVSRRFHLVYVFDRILDKDTFKYCSTTLSEALVRDTGEELEDKCGEKMSQYMNGCYGNDENYKTYLVYSLEDVSKYNYNISILLNTTIQTVEEDKDTTLNVKLQKGEIEEEVEISSEDYFDERLLNDWDRLETNEFLKTRDWENYRRNTKYYYRVEKPFWEKDLYQTIDNEYFSLFWYNNRVMDGSKRRKGLYQRMCLRKLINNDITPMELVINTIIDIVRFYDNSDGVLNSDFLKRNVLNCLALSVEEIEEKFKGELEYLRNTTKPKKGIIYKSRDAHSKDTTYLILDDYYNTNLDVKQNLVYINEVCGFTISERTIYNYIKERGIKTDSSKLTDEEIVGLLDFSISAIANYDILKDSGIKISKKRLYKLYKDNKDKIVECKERDIDTTLNVKLQKEEIKPEVNMNFNFSMEYENPFKNWYPNMDLYYPNGIPQFA